MFSWYNASFNEHRDNFSNKCFILALYSLCEFSSFYSTATIRSMDTPHSRRFLHVSAHNPTFLPSNHKEALNQSVITSNRLSGDDLNMKPAIHTVITLPKFEPEVTPVQYSPQPLLRTSVLVLRLTDTVSGH
jgi:hypothetical protein